MGVRSEPLPSQAPNTLLTFITLYTSPKTPLQATRGVPTSFNHEMPAQRVPARILHDAQDFEECKAEAMLKAFLAFITEDGQELSLDQAVAAVLPVANDAGIKEQLEIYYNAENEEESCKPFIAAMNRALEKLEKIKPNGVRPAEGRYQRILQRNDPGITRGRHVTLSVVDVQPKPSDRADTLETSLCACATELENTRRHNVINSAVKPSSVSRLMGGSSDGGREETTPSPDFKHVTTHQNTPKSYTLQPLIARTGSEKYLDPSDDGFELVEVPEIASSQSSYDSTGANSSRDRRLGWSLHSAKKCEGSLHQPTSEPQSSVSFDSTGLDSLRDTRSGRSSHTKRRREESSEGPGAEREPKRIKMQTLPETLPKQTQTPLRPTLDKPTQAALYGAEHLCHSLRCTHSIGLVIEDEFVWIWWYDRQGAIQAEAFDFIGNLPYFLVLLLAFQRFRLEDFGFCPEFEESDSLDGHMLDVKVKPSLGTFYSFELENDDEAQYTCHISIGKNVNADAHLSISGRTTRAGDCTVHGEQGFVNLSGDQKLFCKFSWPEDARDREADLIFQAHKRLKSDPDPEIQNLTKHLPELFFTFDAPHTSTSIIREKLGLSNPKQGARSLRGLVFGKLKPITDLTVLPMDRASGQPLWIVFWQCFAVHFALWAAGLQHCDISVKNLMYCERPGEKLCGVLNDYDLARIEGAPLKKSDRAGTLPFLAIELLSDAALRGEVKRLYTHDAESFIWVLLWLLHRYQDKEEIVHNLGPLLGWLSRSLGFIEIAKFAVARDIRRGRTPQAASVYHYRAELLGEYFGDDRNTLRLVNRPMSLVVKTITSIMKEEWDPDFDSELDPAYKPKSESSEDVEKARKCIESLELPPEVEMVANKKGSKLIER